MAEKGKRGLGTGLGALFALDEEENEVTSVSISRVEPRSKQPRAIFDPQALEELADSVREYGVLQPITVRKMDSGYYQIIAGERRWRASKMAGLSEIPVRVIEADDKLVSEIALVENLQREDLNPLEEARGYKALIDEYGMTQEEVAKRVGKSRPTITNALRLLTLSEEVMVMAENGDISAGHARAIASLPTEDLQFYAASQVVKNELSVRKTEALVKKLQRQPIETVDKSMEVDYIAYVVKDLEKALGRKVSIQERGNRGKIMLEYYGEEDREALIELLKHINK